MYANSIVAEAGNVSASLAGGARIKFKHPFLLGQLEDQTADEVDVTKCLRLSDEFFKADPLLPAAVFEPMADGGAVVVTNNCQAGKASLNVAETSGLVYYGDLVAMAQLIHVSNDTVGGAFIKEKLINGRLFRRIYFGVFFVDIGTDRVHGTAVPVYPITFVYAGWAKGMVKNENSKITIHTIGNQYGYKGNFNAYPTDDLTGFGLGQTDMDNALQNSGVTPDSGLVQTELN